MNSDSIKVKLILYTVAILLFSMFVASLYSVITIYNKTNKEFESNLSSKMIATDILLENTIKELSDTTLANAKNNTILISIQFNIMAQIEGYANTIKNSNSHIDDIILLSNNDVLYSTMENSKSHLPEVIESSLHTNNSFTGFFFNDIPYLVSSAALIDSTGTRFGSMIIISKLGKESNLVNEIERKLKSKLFIFYKKNMNKEFVYFSKNRDVILSPIPAKKEFVKENITIDKENYFLYCKVYEDLFKKSKLILTVGKDRAELSRSIFEIFIIFTIIFIIFSGIAIMLIIIILNYFLNPIHDLMIAMGEISAGNLSKRYTITRYDEIGILGKDFNSLAEKMEIMIRDLEFANKRLLEFNNMKDEFLANTSHELRTPLHGIIGIVDSVLDNSLGEINDKIRLNLKMVYLSAKRLTNLVNDILDFSKLKQSEIVLQQKNCDLKMISYVVCTILEPIAKSKKVELVNSIPENSFTVYCDENRLQQILYNLIGNGLKFTENGEVRVTAEEDSLNKMVNITISDTGIGIPKDKHDKIFESFEQGDGSISRNFGGTGLGLSITKKLVELHNGKIWVDSEIGEGSKFTFSLPLGDSSKTEAISDSKILLPQFTEIDAANIVNIENVSADNVVLEKKFRVLVADDEPINLQVIVNQLTPKGYEVVTASDGFEALAILEKNNYCFDIIILDLMMPRISGYDVCKEIRKKHSEIEFPVLMLTAKNLPKDIELGFVYGANDYISKPFEKIELIARVNTLAKLKHAVNESIYKAKEYSREKEEHAVSNRLRIINRDLTAILKVDKVIEMLVKEISKLMNYKSARVLLKKEDTLNLFYYNSSQKTLLIDKENIKQNQNKIIDSIMNTHTYSIFNDIAKNIFDIPEADLSILGVPLICSGNIIGAVIFESEERFSEDKIHLSIILTIIEQASIAIANAQLFEKTELTNKKLETSLEELRDAQNQLILSEKMAVLGGLVAGVAHEINTPVGIGITASTHISEETEKFKVKYKTQTLFEDDMDLFLNTIIMGNDMIYSNLKKAAELVRSFKQVSVDQITEEKREFDLKEYILDTIQSLHHKLKQGKHEVFVESKEKININSYPGGFYQVFTNLIINTLIHGFEGLENRKISIEIERVDSRVRITYNDNGKGIAPDILPRIFDPFFTTKRGRGGTGLGLNIVYNIVSQKLNGSLECKSTPGVGTTFIITVPVTF